MRLSIDVEPRKARVEMLPLIDVVFLLLVFFVYAMLSMVVHRGLRVELPEAASATLEDRDYVSITVTDANRILVNETPVALAEVAVLVNRMRTKPDTPVFIEGDRRADLGVAIQILDRLRTAGIDQVTFSCKEAADAAANP